jgi:release factor glutamine methyltransferase
VGIDISPAALEQAAENRRRAGLGARVEFRRSGTDPFSAIESGELFGLIVSNPPYIRDDELADLPIEVRQFDPLEALTGGADGLRILRQITKCAPDHLEPTGTLFLEIGAFQASAVCQLLKDTGRWTGVTSFTDLAGHDRFIVASLL